MTRSVKIAVYQIMSTVKMQAKDLACCAVHDMCMYPRIQFTKSRKCIQIPGFEPDSVPCMTGDFIDCVFETFVGYTDLMLT
jgi:hypothetical protein